jgi:hypothetical protein
MMKVYRHTQNATVLRWAMGLAALSFTIAGAIAHWTFFISIPVLLLVGWLFHSLTIEIDEEELRWWFGPGFISNRVAVADISEATVVRTSIIEGWGIHYTRYGWLYNVAGFDAVAIKLTSGKRYGLGTDEPAKLLAELTAARRP